MFHKNIGAQVWLELLAGPTAASVGVVAGTAVHVVSATGPPPTMGVCVPQKVLSRARLQASGWAAEAPPSCWGNSVSEGGSLVGSQAVRAPAA